MGWSCDWLVTPGYRAAARSDTSEPIAWMVSGRYLRRPVQRLQGPPVLDVGDGVRPDLVHSAGHRGPVNPEHDRQRGVPDLQPQDRQRDQHPVGEH